MNINRHRRHLLQASAAAWGLLSLRPAAACEYFAPTLRITHPWTRATPASAPFAVLGMRFDEVAVNDELIGVFTPVAQAVVLVRAGVASALPLSIPAGQDTVLGSVDPNEVVTHLRLMQLTEDLQVGRSYPLKLQFRQGGMVKATLNVDYARFG